MNITDLVKEHPTIKVEVTADDLFSSIKKAVAEVIGESKKEVKEETYLTTQQVCKLLGITHSTAWRWNVKDNYLRPVSIGGKKRYKRTDVERILGKEITA